VTGAILNSISENTRKVTIQNGAINFYTALYNSRTKSYSWTSDGFIADNYNGYFNISSSYNSIKLSSIYYLFFEASYGIVLNSSSMYGSSLPSTSMTGRIFFKTS
uniref:hypothetical protein n=1 Tax=uncultured Methanobrevibacter sp. TaxID=253161 RepID=UPI002607B4F7